MKARATYLQKIFTMVKSGECLSIADLTFDPTGPGLGA